MKLDTIEKFIVLSIALIVLVVSVGLYNEYVKEQQCEDKGGTYIYRFNTCLAEGITIP